MPMARIRRDSAGLVVAVASRDNRTFYQNAFNAVKAWEIAT